MWWWTACSAPPETVEPASPPSARLDTWQAMIEDRRAIRHPADGGGAAALVDGPAQIAAGETGTWTVRYTAGPHGVAAGGVVFLQSSPFWGWSPAQSAAPGSPGYTAAVGVPDGVRLTARTLAEGLVGFEIGGRDLASGETFDIVYSDARADRFAERASAMWVAVDGDGDGVRKLVPTLVAVAVTARPPVRWHVTVPSAAEPGEPIRVTLAALDAVGNAFFPWTGPVRLDVPDGLTGPSVVEVRADGVAEVVVTADKPGIYTIRTRSDDGLAGQSNPIVVRAGAERILWGDLQIHTAVSDGSGALDDVYRYARDVAALDVAAITDHDHWGMQFLDADPAAWKAASEAALRWNHPGRFVALPGYEWTSWLYGHRHVVGFAAPPPLCSSLDDRCDRPEELWAALAGSDALTFAHHSAGGPVATDWSIAPDPLFEPIVEIASVHGQSESSDAPGPIYDAVPGAFVHEVLVSKRYTLGFIGSTDGHDGHPGLSHLAGGQGGLAAILAESATPAAVRAALVARRTYATNGVRMILRVTLDGQPMGSVLPVPAAPIEAVVRVVGTTPVTAIEVIGPAGVSARYPADGPTAYAAFPVDGLAAGDFWYVRVLQADGGVAWSSPHYVR